jgi:hypothetical protein
VVGEARKPGDEGVVVELATGEVPTTLLAIHADPDDDVALLKVTPVAREWKTAHAKGVRTPLPSRVHREEDCAWLDDADLLLDDPLVLYGFPDRIGDTRTVHYEGPSERPGGLPGRFHHLFKAGQVVPGFSGGPLLNLRTGCVIGVVTETRSRTSDLGGTAIPASLVRQLLGKAVASTKAAVVREWREALRERAKLINGALATVAGRHRDLPFAGTIENFIVDYRGDKSPVLFGGRRRQLDELTAWLENPTAPYALITAAAGRGKSALLVRWLGELASPQRAEHPGPTHIIFVPVSVRYGLNTEERVFRALVSRLDGVYEIAQSDGISPSVSERDAFSSYLRAEPPSGVRVLLVIDGLDEAAGWEIGPGDFPRDPAARVKVVVSARTLADRSGRQWLDTLGWTPGQAICLELPPLGRADLAELLRSLGPPLATRASTPAFVDRVHRLSDGGDPLVLNLLLKDLHSDVNCLDAMADDARPSGLEGYFDNWWEQQEKLWGGTLARSSIHTRNVFNLLAMAFGPLQRKNLLELARRLRADCSGDDLDEALHWLNRFVVHDAEPGSYVLAHPRFAEYRYSKLQRDDEHHDYERSFLDWGRATLAAWSGTPKPQEATPYITRYYGAHLKRAGGTTEEFMALVSPGWQAAWDFLGDDYNGYYGDVTRAWEAAAAIDKADLAAGRPGSWIGDEWRCAYDLAQRKSFAQSLHPSMLGPLLRHRLWTGRRCLTFIQQLEEPFVQTEALAAVLPWLAPSLLPEAERLLARCKVTFQESVASALAAYCLRLWQLGERQRALQYARDWEPCLARSMALVTLAGQMEDRAQRSDPIFEALANLENLDWPDIGLLMEHVRQEFARFGVQPNMAREDDEWVTPGLDAAARVEALRLMLAGMERSFGRPVSIDKLSHDEDGQFLELALPWLKRAEAAKHLLRLFAAIEAGEIRLLATDVIVDVAPFVTDELLEAAEIAAASASRRRSDSEGQRARALISLVPVMPRARQVLIAPQLLSIAADLPRFGSDDKRVEFVVGLVKLGLGNEVLDLIRQRELAGDEWTAELIEAIVPHLSLAQTQLCITYLEIFASARRDRALPIVRARLAEFGPSEARAALDMVQQEESRDVRRLVAVTLAQWLDAPPENLDASVRVCAALASTEPELALSGLASLTRHLTVQLSPSKFAEAVNGFASETARGEALTLLAPHLSREAALDQTVQSVYIDLPHKIGYVESEYISSFCRRLVELDERDAAIQFGQRLPKPSSDFGWLMPPAALRAIPDLPLKVVERQRLLVEELADSWHKPWHQCVALAALVPYIGDEPWYAAWANATADLRRHDISRFLSTQIHWALRYLAKDKAEQAFATSFGTRFDDPEWRRRFLDAEILQELVQYYPAPWLETMRIEDVATESGHDRSRAEGAVAVRLAELGRGKEGLEWARKMSYPQPDVVAQALLVLPGEGITDWIDWALGRLPTYDSYPRVWRALLARWTEMRADEMVGVYKLWLDRVAKRPRRHALIELLGFLPAIERLGGKEALACIRSAIDDR